MKNKFWTLQSKPVNRFAPENIFNRKRFAYFFLILCLFICNPGVDAAARNGISSIPADLQIQKFSGFNHSIFLSQFDFSVFGFQEPETLFGRDPNLISIVWSVLWKIPWRAQFGKLFEWTPFLFALVWLFVWHLIMLAIHYVRSQKQQTVSSIFYEFTKFVQIIYGFCCTQALL